MDQKTYEFVEKFGLYFEGSGMSATAGRILAYLLICQPREQSSADLVRALKSTGGSISTNTRVLVQVGMIARVPNRGRRGSHFEVTDDAWVTLASEQDKAIVRFMELLEEGLEALQDAPEEHRARLTAAHAFYGFFGEQFRRITSSWRDREQARLAAARAAKGD